MFEGGTVVVVVPAFNERDFVGHVLRTMPTFVDHVVVVDDGSTDGTAEVARATGDGRVRVLVHPVRRGVGAALASGYAEGIGLTVRPRDVLCVMAGDGQMDPLDLATVAGPVLRGEAEYVKGERFSSPDVRGQMGLPRWLGGRAFSTLTALATRTPVTDSQCGFTALSRQAAQALDLAGLWPSFGYPNDLLGQLAARRMRVVEVPVRPVYGTERSKLGLRHLPAIFYVIGRAALRRRNARNIPPFSAHVTPSDDEAKRQLHPGPSVSS